MLLASAMRPLAELLRVKWSAVDRMFESSVAIGTRVTVRPQHSTSATSSVGQNQERNQGSNCSAVRACDTIQWSHPSGTVPPRNTTEPCVGPKRRIGRMNMETTMASLGQRRRSTRLVIECRVEAGTDQSDRFAHGRVQPVQWQRAAMLPSRRSLYRDDQCRCTHAAGVVVTYHKRPPPRLGDLCVLSLQCSIVACRCSDRPVE
ncbi:hypothetical protein Pla52n_00010 [Stieleria varia]|uniref:Uncharacterized protein n=1 Tax=Stieleria varia TaxID=2528005 RepID=A0A5C6B651_9BACT|nr:hypothetical protein Pla52n_00010 [Stieleria varia]